MFQVKNGGYTVGDFMTGRQHLHVVKPSTSVDDGNIAKHDNNLPCNNIYRTCSPYDLSLFLEIVTALELLVEKKVTGLPVIDDDWNLV